MKAAILAACMASVAHAEDCADVPQLEAFATKWERDAATLMSGNLPGDDRMQRMGRGLAFQRAADDIRQMLNRPIARNRDNAPKPWPADDQRGTTKLLELIVPGFAVVVVSAPERAVPQP